MGISGLLPLLKSVHKPTHLSELAGKTIAVDAYVWLHRGAYACATELVTGKPTTKYIEYAMHRVRLLQFHKITPYIVFDGGPLPAKKGTEVERKRNRDENLTLATELARRGQHSNAREHYVKCVDITPQMAFQLIKALRAEQIPYVVAPYEADAQLFHLESIGLVDGVLTEDSDLLVFGTQTLLLKLDSSTAMCTAISANTLASNAVADLALHGWGVKELRECAMLSGCDYIDGVRGVGLKTASKYLRKWGTVERTLRALRMDGKTVEADWEQRMRKAEVGFLNQRVWDPRREEIVYLTEPDWATWDSEREKFVGGYIEAVLAGGIARGDVDPITLEPMVDIMPSFQPSKRIARPGPLAFRDFNRRDVADNDKAVLAQGSLLQFFSKQPRNTALLASTPSPVLPPPPSCSMQIGRASGKRTLAEQYDRESSVKRPKLTDTNAIEKLSRSSKFFSPMTVASTSSQPHIQAAFDDDKENLEELEDLDEADDELECLQEVDPVEQEEGYMSPPFSSPKRMEVASSLERPATPDFSSPLQSRLSPRLPQQLEQTETPTTPRRGKSDDGVRLEAHEAGSDDENSAWGSSDGRITSPPMTSFKMVTTPHTMVKTFRTGHTKVQIYEPLIYDTPQTSIPPQDTLTVDLRDMFTGTSGSSDGDRAVPSPVTPLDDEPIRCAIAQSDDVIEDDDADAGTQWEERHKIVAAGWGKRFSNTQEQVKRRSPVRDSCKSISVNGKGKEKAQPPAALRRRETIATSFHPGVPQQSSSLSEHPKGPANKPRRSEPLPPPLVMDFIGTPARLVSVSATPQTGGGPEDIDIASDLLNSPGSSQGAVVDDPGTAPTGMSSIMKLQAYRFR